MALCLCPRQYSRGRFLASQGLVIRAASPSHLHQSSPQPPAQRSGSRSLSSPPLLGLHCALAERRFTRNAKSLAAVGARHRQCDILHLFKTTVIIARREFIARELGCRHEVGWTMYAFVPENFPRRRNLRDPARVPCLGNVMAHGETGEPAGPGFG